MAFEDDDTTGAIDTGEDWQPGQQPAQQEQPPAKPQQPGSASLPNMGPPPVAQEMAQTSAREGVSKLGSKIGEDIGQGVKNLQNDPAVKRIISYLMGDGGIDPAALDQAGRQADPQGQLSADDRNLMAIDAAAQKGGPEAAWKMLQGHRIAYNAKQAFAATALKGTPQKPADIRAAVDAANQASQHILDGSSIQFAQSQGGVTATVTSPGGQPQMIQLSPQQFAQYLNVGGDGQWDKVMEHTAPVTLMRLAKSQGPATRVDQAQAPPRGRERQTFQEQADTAQEQAANPPVATSTKTNVGKTPSSMNLSGSDERSAAPTEGADDNYDSALQARAMRMFPSISQGQQREQWMAANEARQEELENKVSVAGTKADAMRDVAEAVATGKVEAATATGEYRERGWKYASDAKTRNEQIKADAKAAHDGNQEAHQRIESARKAIAAKRATAATLSPEDEATEKMIVQAAGAGAKPQAQQPSQAPAQQPKQLSAQDQQASAWAKANPNDPRAKAIMQKLGGQ